MAGQWYELYREKAEETLDRASQYAAGNDLRMAEALAVIGNGYARLAQAEGRKS
jgi:hypothetical protein